MVERQLPKLNVGSSNLLARFLQPLQPSSPQLTEEHLRQLAAARVLSRKINRAASVARFDGWTIAVFGGVSVLFGFMDITSLLIGAVMCTIAFFELRAADRLRRLDPSAIRVLVIDQAVLGSLLIIYSVWSLVSVTNGSSLASVQSQDPQVAQLLASSQGFVQSITAIVYGALIAVAVGGCGGMILYYLSRRRHLQEYLQKTPQWIIAMQATGVTL